MPSLAGNSRFILALPKSWIERLWSPKAALAPKGSLESYRLCTEATEIGVQTYDEHRSFRVRQRAGDGQILTRGGWAARAYWCRAFTPVGGGTQAGKPMTKPLITSRSQQVPLDAAVRSRWASGPRLAVLTEQGRASRSVAEGPKAGRVYVDGCGLFKEGRPFRIRGVTYGTFRENSPGDLFPSGPTLNRDFSEIAENGFNVVRTYTVPPDRVLDAAAQYGLQLLVGVHWPDWRYLIGASRWERRAVEQAARGSVREAAMRLREHPHVLALCLGNEVPADVVRWWGRHRVGRCIDDLALAVREVDSGQLVTYASYPTSEYLVVDELDFLTFNVFLEHKVDLRKYLTRIHHLGGGRPIVLGEIGAPVAGDAPDDERRQAESIEWQLETALERGMAGACLFSWTDDWWVGGRPVTGWRFGLTRSDRSSRPALGVARTWNERSVADLQFTWPSITVVVCAYNAADTLAECLQHVCALDYPSLEILVVDDGSTDATDAIARRYPRARLLSIPHAGLSVARNVGLQAARGDIIAYLDSDAYPSPDWPYYLALGMDDRRVGAVGGPNVAPRSDPRGAHRVARAPGGPNHVLVSDDRAEHIPGCNMAFWRKVLVEVGGFDPVYTRAGDDVDLCWRVQDRDWEIGFHPAAYVWHHPRRTVKGYWHQQVGYGQSEALVQARHPDRFTATGTARWRGYIYAPGASLIRRIGRNRIYHGPFGAAAYQSVYRAGGHGLDTAHQLGVPLALTLIVLLPLAAVSMYLIVLPAVGLAGLVLLFVIDAIRSTTPAGWLGNRTVFRWQVAALHLLQPLARSGGRHIRWRSRADRTVEVSPVVGAGRRVGGAIVIIEDRIPRVSLLSQFIDGFRGAGLRVVPVTGWEDHDIEVISSLLVRGRLLSSSHPPGWIQVRLRMRARPVIAPALLGVVVLLAMLQPLAAAVLVALGAVSLARGIYRLQRCFRAMVAESRGDG